MTGNTLDRLLTVFQLPIGRTVHEKKITLREFFGVVVDV